MAVKVIQNSNTTHEEDMQPLSEIMCNCELCYARLCVSAKQHAEDAMPNCDPLDTFLGSTNPKLLPPSAPSGYNWTGSPMCGDVSFQPTNKVLYQMGMGPEALYSMHSVPDWSYCSKMAGQMLCEADFGLNAISPSPQLYLSKESVLHLRLSAYVALERSGTAYRLINYRNNSALALSENGQYGYVYHFNCRSLINMHHEKLSITFDKERQVLLRTEKPSFVKKDNDYYRLTSHHWAQCRPVSMDYFDRDKTPDILKKSGSDKAADEARLLELINSSVMQKETNGLTSEARIEQRLNGDVTLSWLHGDRINALVVSPLTGSVSLSTRNLEIIATPKNDIYISFADFFVHTEAQQITVSSGAISGRPNFTKSHPCLLKLVTVAPDSQNLSQFCPFMNQQGAAGTQQSHQQQQQHQHGGYRQGGAGGHHGHASRVTHEEASTPVDTTIITEDAGPRSQCESSCANDPTSASPATAAALVAESH